MMPLTMADVGKPITIKRVGGKEETRKFLENLGFVTEEPSLLFHEWEEMSLSM